MLRDKPKRVRRKLRALGVLRARKKKHVASGSVAAASRTRDVAAAAQAAGSATRRDALLAVAAACSAAAVGFELCAGRTRAAAIAVAAASAAKVVRHLHGAALDCARHEGAVLPPRARTCERLRWEWLASTGMVVDGDPDMRLLEECARILAAALAVAPALAGAPGDLAVRLRLASAEASSLAAAARHERERGGIAFHRPAPALM
jgi:hypothetical protein